MVTKKPIWMPVFAVVAALLVGVGASPAGAALPGASETQMLSVSDAVPPLSGNDTSYDVSLSADGRYAVFTSAASNLGSIGTSGRHSQVYLRDVDTGVTHVVSAAGGTAPGNGDSDRAVISADGMFVAFISTSTNLVSSARSGIAQVLLWSRATDSIAHVSLSNDAIPVPANGRAINVAISGDGGVVVYSSNATNLVGASTSGVFQIFARDLSTGQTSLVSVDTRSAGVGGESDSMFPAVSGDGHMVAFASGATLTPVATGGHLQVFARDMGSGTTQMVSVDTAGTQAGSRDSYSPSLSSDGKLVAFTSSAYLTDQGANGLQQVYLRDLHVGSTTLVSIDASGSALANDTNNSPSITSDGRTVAFGSNATNLVPETGGLPSGVRGRVYLRNVDEGRTSLVCRSAATSGPCDDGSGDPAVSGDGSMVAYQSTATDIVPGIDTHNAQIYLRNMAEVPRVERIGGADRFAVSAAVSTDAFSTGVPVAYVASGAGFADALSGSAAAGAQRGPMLLVTKDAIPTVVGIELHRLKPQKIVVLGGPNSVDEAVKTALEAYAPLVTRIAGADRYDVSSAVSAAVFGVSGSGANPTVYVASGEVFPDALSGSAAVGQLGGPVLLVQKNAIPASVAAELTRLTPQKIVVLGGTNTISDSVTTALGRFGSTTRIAGADRFAVSAAVSADAFPAGARTVYVASGTVFPDALSGSAAAVQNDGPVLLVTAGTIPAIVGAELERLDPIRIVVLGGTNTVSDPVLAALEKYLYRAT